MHRNSGGQKPRVTDAKTLQAIVEKLKEDGCEPDEIQRRVVRACVVDLDELNEMLRAA
jgi:hypothetical protein